ncbi:hypothetical protein R3X26_15765 [Vibrio sp. TH_r3]|uniref:hypothetical protein n=1 Tax=Vibrio sp. TH_r3 TaxID=3082084 RepID=UPI00295556F9|nr:hypothetical protein [Vibrio sp. TH_r3]MDV7105862.1 hypothetical protein [Vibrio sp. TH_r3]
MMNFMVRLLLSLLTWEVLPMYKCGCFFCMPIRKQYGKRISTVQLTNLRKLRYYLGVMCFLFGAANIPQAMSAMTTGPSVYIEFKINYIKVTCNVNAPASYELGHLLINSSTTIGNIDIELECSNTGFTNALTASTSHLITGDNRKVKLTSGAWMTLKDNGTEVVFDNNSAFCLSQQNTLSRTCSLEVDATVTPTASAGAFTVPIVFTLAYL